MNWESFNQDYSEEYWASTFIWDARSAKKFYEGSYFVLSRKFGQYPDFDDFFQDSIINLSRMVSADATKFLTNKKALHYLCISVRNKIYDQGRRNNSKKNKSLTPDNDQLVTTQDDLRFVANSEKKFALALQEFDRQLELNPGLMPPVVREFYSNYKSALSMMHNDSLIKGYIQSTMGITSTHYRKLKSEMARIIRDILNDFDPL